MFYVHNTNGTYALMRPIYPWRYNGSGNMAYSYQTPSSNTPSGVPTPPEPKEGDKSDNNDDSIEEPPDIKKKPRKGESK